MAKTYQRHPFSARYADLTGQAWEDFKANLREHGRGERKIVLYEGQVLDGWQLYRACQEEGIEAAFTKLTEGVDPEAFVETANDFRRHEGPAALRARRQARIEREVARRQAGESLQLIADAEGVSKTTVQNDLADSGVTPCTPETVTGKDGRSYPGVTPCTPDVSTIDTSGVQGVTPGANGVPKRGKRKKRPVVHHSELQEEDSLDGKIKEVNGRIESFCRAVMKFVDEECPTDVWLDDLGRRDAAIQKFKDACSTLRTGKCHAACPKCAGEGCVGCRKSGRVPKATFDQMG